MQKGDLTSQVRCVRSLLVVRRDDEPDRRLPWRAFRWRSKADPENAILVNHVEVVVHVDEAERRVFSTASDALNLDLCLVGDNRDVDEGESALDAVRTEPSPPQGPRGHSDARNSPRAYSRIGESAALAQSWRVWSAPVIRVADGASRATGRRGPPSPSIVLPGGAVHSCRLPPESVSNHPHPQPQITARSGRRAGGAKPLEIAAHMAFSELLTAGRRCQFP